MRVLQFIAATAMALACIFTPAHAEKRVALVIGNDRYANLPASEQLQKAVNDSRSVGAALGSIGFDVISGENLGRGALLGKFDELTQRVAPGDTAFFFFSGHGVALDGVNYILPADVPNVAAGQETRLKGEALGEQYIISELAARGASVTVIVLDACRTNPFSRPGGGKGIGGARGLAPPQQVKGVFSLYAASSGQAARDRLHDGDSNPNSVFSQVLVPALTKPDLDLATLAIEVREEVAQIARGAGYDQRPAYYDETIGGRIYLAAGASAQRPSAADAERTWIIIQNTTSIAVLDDFIRKFGNVPIYGSLARERREELAKEPAASSCSGPVAAFFPSRCTAPLTAAQERGLKPKDSFRECGNCPEMVVVPAGAFTMGSPEGERGRVNDEGPQHTVTIGKPFGVGRLHVTVSQFDAFVRETRHEASSKCYVMEAGKWAERRDRSWRNPGYVQEGSHPAVCLTWNDAKAYADWLAQKTGKPYRLLSEAEWEYAARGQTQPGAYPRFWFGDDETDLCRYGNGADRSALEIAGWNNAWKPVPCNDGYARTSPAGRYEPNAFGLYDMAGNAWHWTADCYHDSYNGAPWDGSAWTDGTCIGGRVVRGGAWYSISAGLRAAHRLRYAVPDDNLGFRVARTLAP